ncbi:MAG: electron transport complex subunit RsxB [Pseudomonadota bacterium]
MSAIVALTLLGLFLGFLLGLAANKFKVESDPIVDEIDELLPGTNCGQCGYPGCPAAAEAIANGAAPVNLCPPGGKSLAEELARKLGVSFDASAMDDGPAKIARVDETLCIGCVKCFRECPTDAIVGAPKQIHVVMDRACTGCGKCEDVCPTMCIEMVEPETTLRQWRWPKPQVEVVAEAA